MSKRNYNVFYHLHTVSGIVISCALFIIFFTGAFALFKNEINTWEQYSNENPIAKTKVDYDGILRDLHEKQNLIGQDVQFYVDRDPNRIFVYALPSQDSLNTYEVDDLVYYSYDLNTGESLDYSEHYTLGEFLYRLHFFHQIPGIGIYLSGFVSLFFLFAILTGLIVHWKKMFTNFFSFNIKAKLKRIWTESHTGLGFITLPFQFIFALTGAYFALTVLVILPANFVYDGDLNRVYQEMRPEMATIPWEGYSEQNPVNLNPYVLEQDGRHLSMIYVKNFGGKNMKYYLKGDAAERERFIGSYLQIIDAYDGSSIYSKEPYSFSFISDGQRLLSRLHFGDYGGNWIKGIYFILAFFTCMVIISGVLIWVEARNKKNHSVQDRIFTLNIGHTYLAICLSMIPVTALSFILMLLLNGYAANQQNLVYGIYFTLWIGMMFYFRSLRDNLKVLRFSLLSGAVFSFLIPVAKGLIENGFIWKDFTENEEIASVNLLWVALGISFLWVWLKLPKEKEQIYSYEDLVALRDLEIKQNYKPNKSKSMKIKVSLLWLILCIGWLIHHIYGLFNIYYNETLILEGATGEAPMVHHIYRIVFEGICFAFAICCLEFKKPWFKKLALTWAVLAGLYNTYHLITALIYESTNISELVILALVVLASFILVKSIRDWGKEVD